MHPISTTLAALAVSSASIGAVTLNEQIRRRAEQAYQVLSPSNQVLFNNIQIDEDLATTELHEGFVTGSLNSFGIAVRSSGEWNTSYTPDAPVFGLDDITSMHFNGVASARLEPPTGSNTATTNGIGFSIYTITVDRDTAARFTGSVSIATQGDGDVSGFFNFTIRTISGAGPDIVANIVRAVPGDYEFDETYTLQAGATYRLQMQALATILGPGTVETRRTVALNEGRVDFIPLSIPGDANADSVVDFTDLNTVLSQFGQSGEGLLGDLDQDGSVGFNDLNEVLTNFGAIDG